MKRFLGYLLVLLLVFPPCLAQALEGEEILTYKLGQLDGLGFTPYLRNQSAADGKLKIGKEQIRERLSIVAPYTLRIRTFGCAGGLELIPRIAKEEFGLEVAVGLWISEDQKANDVQLENAARAAKYADCYIFSETLNLKNASADTLLACIRKLRRLLKANGRADIPVMTSEPLDIYEGEGSALLPEVDALCFNYHPYYDGVNPADAGRVWFPEMLDRAQELAEPHGYGVVVGETGYPTFSAFASEEEARLGAAIYQLYAIFEARKRGVTVYSFISFDEGWKAAYGEAEAHFGIWDEYGELKLPELFAGEDADFIAEARQNAPGETGAPAIHIDEWPGDANGFRVRGSVSGVEDPSAYRLMVWIRVQGSWWVKPTWTSALQFIGWDGSFDIAAITPGAANDALQDACSVLLLPAEYDPDIHVYANNLKHALVIQSNE